MGGREEYRIFIGGLSRNTSQRHLEDTFSRYGRIVDCLVMVERDTGRPRGFGFLSFADRRAMENAIRDMHGRELDGRIISVNKAEPRLGADDPHDSYGDRRSGIRDNYRGGDRQLPDSADECFKCGRLGHWARDCPSSGGPRYPSQSEYVSGDRFVGDRDYDYDRYYEHPSVGGRYESRGQFDSRDAYGSRDHYSSERYPPSDPYGGDRYMDRYPQSGYERDGGLRGAGGPARYDKGSYRDRAQAHPYNPPPRRSGLR